MAVKRVLSVGQCFADHSSIARILERQFAAEVVSASTTEEALDALRQGKFELVLVNRIFDADGTGGINLIQEIKAEENLKDVPVMLVSNFADAQREAVASGAAPGFGKAALGQPQTLERLKTYLES